MTYQKAMEIVKKGGKVRRPCWQPGWVEQGIFQGEPTPFYRNPAPVMVADILMPEIFVVYTPFKRREYPYYEEDLKETDWIEA